jgi:hypothetical protein
MNRPDTLFELVAKHLKRERRIIGDLCPVNDKAGRFVYHHEPFILKEDWKHVVIQSVG